MRHVGLAVEAHPIRHRREQVADGRPRVPFVPEREQVPKMLIERIAFNGETGELAITWRMAGFGNLAKEIAP